MEDKDAFAPDMEMFPLHLASGDELMPVKRNINVSGQYIHTKIKTGSKKTKPFLYLHNVIS